MERIERGSGGEAERRAALCGLLDEEARLIGACVVMETRIERQTRKRDVREFFAKVCRRYFF